MSFILRGGLFAQRGKRLNNREHERRTGTHKNTVASVREELESTGKIAQLDERVSGDGRVRPASQPKREPQPEPAPGITSEEVDELNQLPTEQSTMEQPEPVPVSTFQASPSLGDCSNRTRTPR